jgi:hypothetical protein
VAIEKALEKLQKIENKNLTSRPASGFISWLRSAQQVLIAIWFTHVFALLHGS